jgi:metallo-beta-lactamase family protein
VKLSFHGADRGVTGSCHMRECVNRRILVDCGMFQGSRELAEEKGVAFDFDPAAIPTLTWIIAAGFRCSPSVDFAGK